MRALIFSEVAGGAVRCGVCPHGCIVKDGATGVCGVRRNDGGVLNALNHGLLVAMGDDPIEKKPLFHFKPGSHSFSIAAAGCNLRCAHCQNWRISQWPVMNPGRTIPGDSVAAADVVSAALERGCSSISYTYTEPAMFVEYALEVMALARDSLLANVFVTNGYISKGCVSRVAPLLDAANVDLKSSSDDFYRHQCGGRVAPVKDTIAALHAAGVWVEVTTLIIPGLNDSDSDIRDVAGFIAGVSIDIPWHVSAFHPDFRTTGIPRTPAASVKRAMDAGMEAGLRYIYGGNLAGEVGEDTACPSCATTLVHREGFSVLANRVTNGCCPVCGAAVAGRW
ncbi:MAG: AmmeMemoRadiSam system radical SAM enzyme [Myxococcota bacterium]